MMLAFLFFALTAFASGEKVTVEGSVRCPDSTPISGVDVYLTQSLIGINNNKIVGKVTTNEEGRFTLTGESSESQTFSVFTGFRCDSNNASSAISQCPSFFKGHPTGLFIGGRNCPTYNYGPQWAYMKTDIPSAVNVEAKSEDRIVDVDIVLNPSNIRIGKRFYSNQ